MFFIFSKLLAFLPFGNLLRGTTGKIMLVGAVVVALLFVYWKWKDSIRDEALSFFNQKQSEQIAKEQNDQYEIFQKIVDEQNRLIGEVVKTQQNLTKSVTDIRRNISGSGSSTPANDVLKDTVRQLKILNLENQTPRDKPAN